MLQQQDKEKRIKMCNWLNEKLEQTPSWLNHIWFSDEAYFHLNGAVNNHNNVFWGEQKPEEIIEKHLKGSTPSQTSSSWPGEYLNVLN